MKLERLSENQIRCTLYKSDLADRKLHLTELAYGTDKAKALFRELMQQASEELGFEADNIPLMIEAVPVSPECLILLITKVDDPEEFNSRFSRFTSPVVQDVDIEGDEEEYDDFEPMDADMISENEPREMQGNGSRFEQLLETIGDIAGGIVNAAAQSAQSKMDSKLSNGARTEVSSKDLIRIFAFKNLDDVIISARLVDNVYKSDNSLYKNPQDSRFYLYMTRNNNTDTEFMKCCNMVSEYGSRVRALSSTKEHMDEHYKVIIECNALQTLAKL